MIADQFDIIQPKGSACIVPALDESTPWIHVAKGGPHCLALTVCRVC